MIEAYHRPSQREEALQLLARSEPKTIVLAGGLVVNQRQPEPVEVVDIQDLGLTSIKSRGKTLTLGAGVTLQQMLELDEVSSALARSIRHQDSYNRRQMATVAGSLLASGGRSPFLTACYALDPVLTIAEHGQEDRQEHLGDVLSLREERLNGKLITEVAVPRNAVLAYHYVARTPADRPIVAAAAARWPSGRTRVVLGGHGALPILVVDGPHADGAVRAAADAYSEAGDQWASAAYREETAAVLVGRCLQEIESSEEGNG